MTIPYFVMTFVPSTIGKRSRCTPSLETSGPRVLSAPTILSISSMKIMPDVSALWMASFFTSSMSINFDASCCLSISRASLTFTLFRFFLVGKRASNPSGIFKFSSSVPIGLITSKKGETFSSTSISTSRSSNLPSSNISLSFSLVSSMSSVFWYGAGKRISRILSRARL